MASLNRVFLIGVVATPPADRRDVCEFVLGVPEERAGKARLERVRIVATGPIADAIRELRTAQAVYADGRLVRSPDGAAVQASAVIALGDAPPEAAPAEEPAGTHASPRAHDRGGHPRRLHAGTEGERVVWVRPTRVGDPAGPRRARPRR
jgi:hypothetical protein